MKWYNATARVISALTIKLKENSLFVVQIKIKNKKIEYIGWIRWGCQQNEN